MLEFMGQLEENFDSDYYDFIFKDNQSINGYSEGLWTDGKRLILNPSYMTIEYDWAVLKRDLDSNTLRSILGFFRRMECYNVPDYYDIPKEPEE